ncbi:MAG: hypothetical protein LBD03_03520 [Methanobrevibacter sp.]|jgi:type I restriction enzyme R subunit|nr:hypothetical protein [Candidatus Methanovirga procula]
MENSPELKSKVDLIEKFINQNNICDDSVDNVEEDFENYLNKEKEKSVNDLIKEEDLKEEVIKKVISKYEFSGKIRNDLVKKSFEEKLGIISKKTKLDTVKDKIVKLVERFTW